MEYRRRVNQTNAFTLLQVHKRKVTLIGSLKRYILVNENFTLTIALTKISFPRQVRNNTSDIDRREVRNS